MTQSELLTQITKQLRSAGIDEAAHEARQLFQSALSIPATLLISRANRTVEDTDRLKLESLVNRRLTREPLSHILGDVGFWTLTLKVDANVLTPRPDSETIIDTALTLIPDHSTRLNILDMGTGSGALLLALLSEYPNARGIGTDISSDALTLAKLNAKKNNLASRAHFQHTSWANDITGPFDIIVSNPPYIASSVIEILQPEVKDFEPHLALDGGKDGLEFYPHLFSETHRLLKPGGVALFEIGFDQGQSILSLANQYKLSKLKLIQDLNRQDRILRACLPPLKQNK